MSDDTRMDRAERIRRMREGNRDGTDETADDATDGSEQAEPTSSPSDESPTMTGDDAMVAAQRAAESAAAVTSDDGTEGTAVEPAQQGDISASLDVMQGPTGVDLPDQDAIDDAMAGGDIARAAGTTEAAAMDEDTSTGDEELVRVLEFALGDEYYCLDIEYVEEIVKRESITRVPNTADYVEGVVDLRGQITTILEPKAMMDIDTAGEQNLMVVFDPEMFEEQGAVGWIVDEVRQVAPVAESEVNSPPVDADYINGVVDRDDHEQFVIWVEPDDALANATGDDEQ